MSLACRIDTPAGELVLLGTEDALTGIHFAEGRCPPHGPYIPARASALFAAAGEQLDAYFAGTLRAFDLPLARLGTPFQRRAWAALGDVPYGSTTTYAALARTLGTGPRAVGLANGRNPWSIVVPCHRLLGSDGALTGYGGGVERKRFLIDLERANSP